MRTRKEIEEDQKEGGTWIDQNDRKIIIELLLDIRETLQVQLTERKD